MAAKPRPERITQQRVINLMTGAATTGALGYRYLGDWTKRDTNRPVEADILRANLSRRGIPETHLRAALHQLQVATETASVSLYQANLRTYQLLRYGVKVQTAIGQPHETVHLIDWDNPDNNDFAIAEEVTLRGGHERRPDLVVYLNGIAIAVIELKRGSVEMADGIRQLITNQEAIFNESFFSTVQLTLAGNDSQGLRYGTVGTPEQFYVEWKEETAAPSTGGAMVAGALLDRPLAQLLDKTRLLDIVRNGVIFDGGKKKVPRPHQYFAFKAAQERIKRREGGVIWHTQGSGKSILMVLIAKWLLEFDPDGRILIVTDRDELDKQIEGVMKDGGVLPDAAPSPRITKRRELVEKLTATSPRLLCALLHKFDPDFSGDRPQVYGRFYVFVDECHRTQGGDMNRQMKRWLDTALFIGFTGTPLLRRDKPMTRDVFGTYIHTYKFHQAVDDKVVLDLKYEARDVPQRLTSQAAIDQWFEQKTKGLNGFQKSELRRRWATMEELMSAGERKSRIVASIIEDFSIKPRLNNDRGTAILVAASIYDACHYFRLFHATTFGQYCGLVTSYQPNHNAISREPAHSDERYKFDTYTKMVLEPGQTTKQYEDKVKERFIKEPANLKLLIVVSKLLTGFDAPSCSYIYLDNELRDHNLFQAICRTNRLDDDSKDYGYVVDFKELFRDVQEAIAVYNSDELDTEGGDASSNNVEMKDWLVEGRHRLETSREILKYLCEPVKAPREMEQYLAWFCGDAADPNALTDTEVVRVPFYKAVAAFLRAYAALAGDLEAAGYRDVEIDGLRRDTDHYTDVRAAIKRHSGEELDIKPYEADMRHLINTYIQADLATTLGDLGSVSLTDLIVKTGIHDAIATQLNAKGQLSEKAVAEGIINNIRRTIIREQLTDPRFYEQMSSLLGDLIQQRKSETQSYEAFLRGAEALIKRMAEKGVASRLPAELKGNRRAAVLFNNLDSLPHSTFQYPMAEPERVDLALEIDRVVRDNAPTGWKGDDAREAKVLNALFPLMQRDREATMALFDIIKNQPDA